VDELDRDRPLADGGRHALGRPVPHVADRSDPRQDGLHRHRERAEAMRLSDEWVRAGTDPASPLVREEGTALVRSYAALLAAVHR
jgi:hypothetical protein